MGKLPTPGSEVYKPLALPPGAVCPCGGTAAFVLRRPDGRGKGKEGFACRRCAESFAGANGVAMPGGAHAS